MFSHKKKFVERRFFAGRGSHVFFQTKNAVLWASGRNTEGQLGLGNCVDIYTPVKVDFFKAKTQMEILKVSIGSFHTLFVVKGRLSRRAFSVGSNYHLQLSNNNQGDGNVSVPVQVMLEKQCSSSRVRDVAAGSICSYIILEDGCVCSAGSNSHCQLGHGQIKGGTEIAIGKKIPSLSGVKKVVTGECWAIFLTISNSLYGMGHNYGQFGIGHTRPQQRGPFEICFFKKRRIHIDLLFSSDNTAYFVTPKNEVYCCGYGDSGEFANGEQDDTTVPILSQSLSNFQVFCSGNSIGHVIWKKHDKIFGCGYDSWNFGHVGEDGRRVEFTFAPVEIKIDLGAGKDVVQIVAHKMGSYLICSDGSIYACGDGRFGTLLNGSSDQTPRITETFIFVGKYDLMPIGLKNNKEKLERLRFMSSRFVSIHSLVIIFWKFEGEKRKITK